MADETTERLAELERRVAALEGAGRPVPERPAGDDRFWALDRLRQLAPAPGGVLFTGTVTLPDGARYEWQQARPTSWLLDLDPSELAGALAALGHPVRLAILRQVLGGRHGSAELAGSDELGTTGQLYHHLRALTAAGWLRSIGRGRYEVPAERVVPLLTVLAAAHH